MFFERIPAAGDSLEPHTRRVYRNAASFANYLECRFGTANAAGVFEFEGAKWVFSHRSNDENGMFDVLRAPEDSAASYGGADLGQFDCDGFIEARKDIPDFVQVTLPMGQLRKLLQRDNKPSPTPVRRTAP